jgi:hypothetical protein
VSALTHILDYTGRIIIWSLFLCCSGFVAAGPFYIEYFLIYVSGIVQPNTLQEYALGASV